MSETETAAALQSVQATMQRIERALHKTMGTRITREQYAERRGESLATFDRMRKAGKIPPAKDGKWLLADVIEWEGGK
jgi:hypothetical protein